MSEAKKKQAPCSKWMHHKWLPPRKDLAASVVAQAETTDEPIEVSQTCCFCGDTRKIEIVINEELVEE